MSETVYHDGREGLRPGVVWLTWLNGGREGRSYKRWNTESDTTRKTVRAVGEVKWGEDGFFVEVHDEWGTDQGRSRTGHWYVPESVVDSLPSDVTLFWRFTKGPRHFKSLVTFIEDG